MLIEENEIMFRKTPYFVMKCGDLSFIILIQVTKPGGGFFSCKKPPLAALRAAIHPKNALLRIKRSALISR